jgi:hypothetical protein
MPRGAKISSTLNELELVALHSTSKHAPQVETNSWYCMQNNSWKRIGDRLLIKSPIALRDSSILYIAQTTKNVDFLSRMWRFREI